MDSSAQAAPQIVQTGAAQLWHRSEFTIVNVPGAANPFDPDLIRVDAACMLPSGKTINIPAFWYQGYQRGLSGDAEYLNPAGPAEWRLRFTPTEAGNYSVSITVRTNGQLYGSSSTLSFFVAPGAPLTRTGYVRIGGSAQYFETSDGQALRLIGENVCWPGARGTFDYDDWFGSMQGAGENYARLWMCPWSFGIETDANSLTQYQLDHAWKLDYVFQLAEQRGIYLMLCLEYHGVFEVTPDYWGGNNFWPANPYNATNGGPCLNQNAFFTNAAAKILYQKRLRYLVARYGYSQNLLGWQFFNEIDNVYAYLNPNDVAAWHGVMGSWLHTNDPFNHLVTTSLTGSSDRPEMWTVPQLDFATYHSYAEPFPAARLNALAQSFLQRYGKPVLIDEFGTDWSGWNRTNDLYLRGFRQGLWGGALGGSAGTAISWWWDFIHSENDYPAYTALGTILNRTGWGRGAWTNIEFNSSGASPMTIGDPVPGGQPFDLTLPLSGAWGGMPSGRLAVPDAAAAGYSANALNGFVHGLWHTELKVPFVLSAWLTNSARLVMHLNSVSDGSILVVKVDGAELYRTNLPNRDGTYNVNEEYNIDLPVNLPAGKRSIEITNAGNDWFFLDWIRLEELLPASYAGNWLPSPDAIGLRGPHESLLYVIAPGVSFPANAATAILPVAHGQSVTLTNWPAGDFSAEWYDPATGLPAGYSQGVVNNNSLTLALPDFHEDLAGIIYRPPALKTTGLNGTGAFQFQLDSETGGRYFIERSTNLITWTSFLSVTNELGTLGLSETSVTTNPRAFYRAKHQ